MALPRLSYEDWFIHSNILLLIAPYFGFARQCSYFAPLSKHKYVSTATGYSHCFDTYNPCLTYSQCFDTQSGLFQFTQLKHQQTQKDFLLKNFFKNWKKHEETKLYEKALCCICSPVTLQTFKEQLFCRQWKEQNQPPEVFNEKNVSLKVLQNSQKYTSARVRFLIKLQAWDLQLYYKNTLCRLLLVNFQNL